MSWRKGNLTQAQIEEILYASSSDSELSSEEHGWPTEDSDQFFLVEPERNVDEQESVELPSPILDVAAPDVNENDTEINWSCKVDNNLIEDNHKIRTSGPVHDLPVGSSPFDYFKLLFSTSMCETIMINTNKYAEYVQKEKNVTDGKWKPIEHISEIWNFIAIILIMSIAKFPKMKNYWSTNPILGNEMIKNTMTRDRFMKILKYFHLSDREMEKVASDEEFYLMQKLDPLMTDMKKNFKSHFKPYQNMSVDEAMIKYKGRLGIIQYMPKKPTKRGIKIWMLCDSSFGYVYDFDVYCGKKDKIPRSKKGLGYDVVTHLAKSLNPRYCLYFDRFFTSVHLMKDLLARGIYSTGTVQTNRKFLPKDLGKIKLQTTGEIRCFQFTEEPNLLCTIWKDKKRNIFPLHRQ
ncbi:PiggyBac transposable element-derived protein 4 [Araneus ventricosus]|uniref:PiggyBac transposable element-derived protein 4 n=1 Tax=Araneus ventricosus TaxID=182803 RepID=A0A4Y2E7U6_ARAVE|nr:PiggyBac transposable element-derived protein 4 [Araneus ventricosus]